MRDHKRKSAVPPADLLYRTYNSLFLSLPFNKIKETGNHLALFAQECETGFKAGKSPIKIVESFWDEYFGEYDKEQRMDMLFYFVQYIERQVVLFDSVEDALFDEAHDLSGPGSLTHMLNRLDTEELEDRLRQKIADFSVRLVLTAHPTQFYPGKVLGIINDLGKVIKSNDLEQIRNLLLQLGKTAFFNRQKPTPSDEALSLGWYLENILFNVLPDILYRLLDALGEDVATFSNTRMLTLGFWPGGDRDGNPFVTAEVTAFVAQRLREGILRCYYRDIRALRRRLTFRGTEDWIIKAEHKINNTLYYPEDEQYHNSQELIADLLQARKILVEEHDELFLEDLDRFILKVRVFGFYFAALDIRQDSRKHGEVWEAILQNWNEKFPWYQLDEFREADEDTKINRLLSTRQTLDENDFSAPFVKETIRSFRAIADIQRANGEAGCHRYIISNCGSALNVAEVLALAQLTMADPQTDLAPLDIIPLFETIDDLAEAGEVMERLYKNERYAKHLASRGNVQTIMLGFSDGTKDGGYLRANWSIYRAKETLTKVSRTYGVSVIFFDGRGGPPGRGGGNNASYYAAHGSDIANQEIQVTIQGQTVSSTYGTVDSATYNIERLFTAGLDHHLFHSRSEELSERERALLDDLAEAAYKAYLGLKNHPEFVPYLEKITALKWYGDSNIASRPTKRSGGEGLRFEDLRAIPFVGAWAQMKQNVPGYYGFGAAIDAFNKEGKKDLLKLLYRRSLFFRTLVENSMQSLSKSNFDVTRHMSKHPEFGEFWKMLHAEYKLTYKTLLELAEQPELLSDNPHSRASIRLREEIVLPLIAMQQYALQKLQDEKLDAATAEACRKLVLRAMFGIINAARNAA